MRKSICVLALAGAACGGSPAPAVQEAPTESTDVSEAPPPARDPDAPPMSPPTTGVRLASGVACLQVSGDTQRGGPDGAERLKVRYRAWDADGVRIDGGGADGTMASWLPMALDPGLRECFEIGSIGQTWRMWIPAAETFTGAGDRVYEIELIEPVERRVPGAPEQVAAPPSSAEVTASGLASRVLEAGTGIARPTAESRVTVHYTGWTTDGAMFDSSVERGRAASFPLRGVIAGWTEGLQLMVAGEVRRFWIPAELAYGDPPRRPGAPAGMLVFDVELMSFE